ncbi:hypothetical protein GC087_06635 [Pantoea sp. JZ2]|uniref:hypothetical protein n=1 Tax=Pantoea sp. JZ2 TaxID=2654189 RepID=UPI002B4610BC|nr:hypothetical protein [Pantoea sp. JZ2]WRH12311.1 hypothetical protein GC087_06635 [Pantoea sp. JZ2]
MAIDIDELNEALILTKSARCIMDKMTDDVSIELNDDNAVYFGVLHILDAIIIKQQTLIDKINTF